MSLYSSRRVFIKLATRASLITVGAAAVNAVGNTEQKDSKSGTEAKPTTDKDEVYEPGGDVRPPKLKHYVEPAFSPSSKEAFVEGVVKISTVVTSEGRPTELRVISGLNAGEDRTAMDAVTEWRFQPGTRTGRAVNVRVTVEVDFHLL